MLFLPLEVEVTDYIRVRIHRCNFKLCCQNCCAVWDINALHRIQAMTFSDVQCVQAYLCISLGSNIHDNRHTHDYCSYFNSPGVYLYCSCALKEVQSLFHTLHQFLLTPYPVHSQSVYLCTICRVRQMLDMGHSDNRLMGLIKNYSYEHHCMDF